MDGSVSLLANIPGISIALKSLLGQRVSTFSTQQKYSSLNLGLVLFILVPLLLRLGSNLAVAYLVCSGCNPPLISAHSRSWLVQSVLTTLRELLHVIVLIEQLACRIGVSTLCSLWLLTSHRELLR